MAREQTQDTLHQQYFHHWFRTLHVQLNIEVCYFLGAHDSTVMSSLNRGSTGLCKRWGKTTNDQNLLEFQEGNHISKLSINVSQEWILHWNI